MQGVYLITNAITGAKYVGQSIDIRRRIMEHKTPNASMRRKSKKFQDDIKQYGIDNFEFSLLEECGKSELLERERYWIAVLQPEYNTIGRSMPAEIRAQISKTLKQRWHDLPESEKEDVCKRLTGPPKGHPVSQETRAKLRKANFGKNKYAVMVVETGQIFPGAHDCAKALNCTYQTVLNQLNGKTTKTKGYHLKRVETNRDECSGVGRR